MRLAISIATCLIAGGLGSWLTTPEIRPWYAGLRKPSWSPPNWLFAHVWTVLYIAMGVAAWLVWESTGLASGPMLLFELQLLLNVGWSAVFFRMHAPGAAFAEIVCLWLAILATSIAFWNTVPLAGGLMVPYLLWVTFAAGLNFTIWRLNE